MKRELGSWKLEEQARFLKWLSTLLERGYPILEGLAFLMLQLPVKQQHLLKQQIDEMKGGATFHQALTKLCFHRDVLGFLYFAEKHGDLSFALKEGCLLLEQKVIYTNRIKRIFQYPLFLIVITLIVFMVMNVWLLPEFRAVFESMNIEENKFLTFMLVISTWLPRLFIIFVLLLILLLFCFLHLYKRIPIVQRMEWLSKIPVYGSIIKKFYSQYFAMQLSQLLGGGLSVYEAISLFEEQHHFQLFQVDATMMMKELRSGEALSSIIRARSYFEQELSRVVALGSANGDMARELYFYSKLSTEALEESLNKKLNVVQPVVFIVIGLMIIGIYLAIMQPTLHMMNGL